MLKRTLMFLAAVSLLVGCSSKPSKEELAEAQTRSTLRTVAYLTAVKAKRISDLSLRALMRIEDSQEAIKQKRFRQARRDARAAAGLLEVVNAELPTVQIKDRIELVARRLVRANVSPQAVVSDLGPIYRRINRISAFIPQEEKAIAVANLDRAKDHMKRGNRAAAILALQRMESIPFLSEPQLPIMNVASHVANALEMMARNQYTASSKPLTSARTTVRIYATGTALSE